MKSPGAHYVLIPSEDTFEAQVITRFSTPILGEMTAGCDAQSTYIEEIAPSKNICIHQLGWTL